MSQFLQLHLDWLQLDRLASPRTVEARRQWLNHADQRLPHGLDHANPRELSQYRATQRWSPWTAHTVDSHLRGFYRHASQSGWYPFDPMADLLKPAPGQREAHPVDDDHLAHALAHAPRWPWRRALMLAAYAGLRCAEACAATMQDITPLGLVVHGKGGKYRTVPVSPELAAELQHRSGVTVQRADGHRVEPLVVGGRGLPMRPQTLSKMQREAWRSLGLPETFTLHSVRHWFATTLNVNGADLRVVQDLLGHSSLATTQVYLSVTDARRAAAVARLPKLEAPGRL